MWATDDVLQDERYINFVILENAPYSKSTTELLDRDLSGRRWSGGLRIADIALLQIFQRRETGEHIWLNVRDGVVGQVSLCTLMLR